MTRRTMALAALGLLLIASSPSPAEAQFGKLKDKLKEKASAVKVPTKTTTAPAAEPQRQPEADAASDGPAAAPVPKAATPGAGAWANFDFVPGEKPLVVEDFAKDRVGNFPKKFELNNGTFEIVQWEGKRWLRSDGDGTFTINIPGGLPERWTAELDLTIPWNGWYVYPGEPMEESPHNVQRVNFGVTSTAVTAKGTETEFDIRSGFGSRLFTICQENCSAVDIERGASTDQDQAITRPFRVRIHADGAYMKVYLDEKRVFNLPNMGKWSGSKLNFHFRANRKGGEQQGALMGNVTINAGGKDMYDALSEDGRLALQGIYFDTGSDKIRPESSGTLAEIAGMLEEHADLNLLIEGHTDNVGDAAANQSLSEKRAAAVVAALGGAPYNIGAGRLKSVGLGATKPAKGNETSEGRQANRRVELVVQK